MPAFTHPYDSSMVSYARPTRARARTRARTSAVGFFFVVVVIARAGTRGVATRCGAFDARGRFFRDGSPPPKKCDAIREARLRARVVSGVTKKRLKIRMGAKEMRSLPSLLLGGGLFLSPRTVFFLVVVGGGG